MGLDHDSLRKVKAAHSSEAKGEFQSVVPISSQMSNYVLESRVLTCVMVIWEGKLHNRRCPPPPTTSSFPPDFCCSSPCHTVWNVPMVSWGLLSLTVPFLLLAHPCLLGGGGKESLAAAQAWSSCSQSISVIGTVLVTNPEHRSLWAPRKHVTSIPARTSTAGNVAWYSPFNV